MSYRCWVIGVVLAASAGGALTLPQPAIASEPDAAEAAAGVPEAVRFNRDVRPILSNKCFECHGPDAAARQAELRLDERDSALSPERADPPAGPAIVPGEPDESELIRRITAEDPDERMPKDDDPLSEAQIQTLRRWIAQGAAYERHWAFIPPDRPELPEVRRTGWARNPIDRFVLARMEAEGLTPAPEADRERLIRRLSLDLTGLPPTPEAVRRFVQDDSPGAYGRLVERLLSDPAYGERMALPWLDAARYADTNGYQNDGKRVMWRWRDWVIEAFNENKPFDEFTIEQLAGDLLPEPTLDQRIATGFNRNHRGNSEGGVIPEEFQAEYVVDRVDTTGTVWLGLTVQCARCHDHKYDPLSQAEYYRLFAFFNNVPEMGRFVRTGNTEPYIKAPTDEQRRVLARHDRRIAAAKEALGAMASRVTAAQKAWEEELVATEATVDQPPVRRGLVDRYPLDGGLSNTAKEEAPEAKWGGGEPAYGEGRAGEAAAFDGSRHVNAGKTGDFRITRPMSIAAWVRPDRVDRGAILTRIEDNTQRRGYEIALEDGRVRFSFITRWITGVARVRTVERIAPDQWHHVAVTYDGQMSARGMRVFVDGEEQELEIVYNRNSNPRGVPRAPLRLGAGPNGNRFRGLIDEVRMYDRVISNREARILATPEPLAAIAGIPAERRSEAQREKIRRCFLDDHAPAEIRQARQRLLKARAAKQRYLKSVPTVMVMEEEPGIRETRVLNRGRYDMPGERVEPGVPEALPAMGEDLPHNRLGLARWLVSPDHPLTARVAVNRFWQMYFGTGLVRTAEDFGTQGERPSHPKLLDWLATEFVRSGWDVKHMQRLLVTSATYRQSAAATPEELRADPANRLLARGPRFRLPAHVIRDQALAAGGLLVRKIGGPSVKPYQPEGLWREIATFGKYERAEGAGLYRRSLYTFWKRTVPPPRLSTFNAAGREACRVRRERTNTPLQALTMMNDPTFVEASRALGERMMREAGESAAARVGFAFRALLARGPDDRERGVLTAAYDRYLDTYRDDPSAARKLIKVGESTPDPSLDPAELAACTAVAMSIMNLDETVTKE